MDKEDLREISEHWSIGGIVVKKNQRNKASLNNKEILLKQKSLILVFYLKFFEEPYKIYVHLFS